MERIQESVKDSFRPPAITWPYYAMAIIFGIVSSLDYGLPRVVLFGLSALIFLSLISKSMISPFPAMMALIVYIPYSKTISGNLGGAVSGLNFTTVLMLIVLLGLYSRMNREEVVSDIPLEQSFRRWILLFCGIGAFSVLHTDMVFAQWSIFTALVDYKRWIAPFLIFFLVSYIVKNKEEGRVLIYLMVISLAIVGIGSLWERHASAERSHYVRLTGIAGQANQMGAFYADYIGLILGFLTLKGIGNARRAFFALGAYGSMMGMFATESRGDAMAFVLAMLLFFFLRSRLLFIGLVLGIAFLAVNIQFLPGGLRNRIQHTVTHQDPYGLSNSDEKLDASSQTRLVIWAGGIKMILTHPILGVGYKMFPQYIYGYVEHSAKTARLSLHFRDGHNAYLMIAAEMGLPALILFLILIGYMIRIAFLAYRASPDPFWKAVSIGTLAGILSLIFSNMFGSRVMSLVLAGYLWALLAILLKLPKWVSEHPAGIADS
ncbi:MAG: O-antigen ligase family protein [Leptospirales bacterium]